MKEVDVGTLHYGQDRLLNDKEFYQHVLLAGVGYGKTFFGARWLETRRAWNRKSKEFLIIAPDNKLLKRRCFEDYREFLSLCGLKEGSRKDYAYNKSDPSFHFIRSNQYIYGVTGEAPEKIVAYNTGSVWIDETALQAEQVYKNAVKRNRCPLAVKRQIFHSTTPEGTNWFWDKFGSHNCPYEDEEQLYSLGQNKLVLHGSSFDNPYLDEEYLNTLKDEFGWDESYFANYVLGKWTSLSKNKFYFSFSEKNIGDYSFDHSNREIVLTFDNNVGQMAWAVIQAGRPDEPKWCARVENNCDGRNIDDACKQFIDRFPPRDFKHLRIKVLGDAALHSRSVHSYQTGYDIIESLLQPLYDQVIIDAHRANPFVEERSRRTNSLFSKAQLCVDRSCKKIINSAKVAESDGSKGIKKPHNDKVTHPMEAIDMAMMVLEPFVVERKRQNGVNAW